MLCSEGPGLGAAWQGVRPQLSVLQAAWPWRSHFSSQLPYLPAGDSSRPYLKGLSQDAVSRQGKAPVAVSGGLAQAPEQSVHTSTLPDAAGWLPAGSGARLVPSDEI